ncbi:MAG: hypothetical protein JNK05_31925 [Myxococcales bacterium]|nr:hypothetical protein [Myxococcales bacterium]
MRIATNRQPSNIDRAERSERAARGRSSNDAAVTTSHTISTLALGLALCAGCATRNARSTFASCPVCASRSQRASPAPERPSRADLLVQLGRFDEFVRRCSRGPHRAFAVASLTIAPDGSVVYAELDTGDHEADECASRLLTAVRVAAFERGPLTVRFPFRVYSPEATRVREVATPIDAAMVFEPDLCTWGAANDPACRAHRESVAVDCPIVP